MPARIRFSKKELIWLAGNTFYGKTQMFSPDFINWLADVPAARIRTAQGRRPVRTAFPRALDPHHDVGDSGAGHPQRVALAPGDEGARPFRPRRALCPRQGQAVGQGRAAAQAATACGFPTSARGGATASCGSAGASRRSRKASATSFTGTSNVLLAMDNDLEAIGTNAHELPMVAAALADDDDRAALGAVPDARSDGAIPMAAIC